MKIESFCEDCRGKYICKLYTKGYNDSQFDNIIIRVDCDDFRQICFRPTKSDIYLSSIPAIFRKTFDHCEDCQFRNKCTFVSNSEMFEKIESMKLLIPRGQNVKFTCKHHCIKIKNNEDILNTTLENDKSKRKSLLSIFKHKKNSKGES